MPGLLDLVDDPNQLGLLSLGMRLMSTPGKFGAALGQAGMGALGDVQQARAAQEARKLREQQMALQQAQELRAQQQFVLQQQLGGLQLNQAARADAEAQAQAERDAAFIKSLPSPQAQALQSLGDNASPTMANATRMPAIDPRQQFLFDAVQARQIKPMDYLTATAKDDAPIKLGEGETLISGKASGFKTLKSGRPKEDDFIRNLRAAGVAEGSPQWNQLLLAKALKDSTHQAPVSVTYGAPVAGVDNSGNPVFFQPGKDGGAPVIVPGVKPAQKLGEKQQNQVVGIDALGQAVDEYVSSLSNWKKPDALNADKRAQIGTVYNNLMLQAKEAYNLGVLNGPDLQIMEAVVRNPLTIVGAVTSNEALAKQATDLKRIMNKIKANINKTPGSVLETSAPGSPKFLGFEPSVSP